jgi:ribosomal protein S27AE
MKKDEFVKVCPRCGSTDIIAESGGEFGSVWDACNECSYGKRNSGTRGPPILEIKKSELEAFRKRIKENPLVK